MAFMINYRDPCRLDFAGATFAGDKLQATRVIERLRCKGYEVTRIAPPLIYAKPTYVQPFILSGKGQKYVRD